MPNPSILPPRSERSAFTLIELLTVIAIIGILAAITIGTVSRVRASAARARCVANLRQLATAGLSWISDNKDQMPDELHWRGSQGTHSIMQYLDLLPANQSGYTQTLASCPSSFRYIPDTKKICWALGYSINSYVCATYNKQNVEQFLPKRQAQKFGQISTPSRTSFFMDGVFKPDGEVVRSVNAYQTVTWETSLPATNGIFTGHGGALNVAYLDGHVRLLPLSEFPASAAPDRTAPFWGGLQ